MTFAEWLATIPGFAAIAASLVGYGALLARVKNVEASVQNLQKEIDELRSLNATVARIDERTEAQKEQGNRLESKLDGALVAMLGEARSWAASHKITPAAPSPAKA